MSISNVEFQEPKLIDMFSASNEEADDYLSSINASEERVSDSLLITPAKNPVENAVKILKDMNVTLFDNTKGTYDNSATWFIQKTESDDTLLKLGKGWTDEEKNQIISAIRGDAPITEAEEYSEDDVDEELFTQDAEQDREFNVADFNKENAARRFGTIKGLVQQYYNMIDGEFNTIEQITNLIKAIYEIVARRYFEAKRVRDFASVKDWERLISDIPNINMAGATFEGAADEYGISEEVYVLAQKWWNKINSTRNAIAMVMAITMIIEKLVQDGDNPESADLLDVKEELDEELLNKVHSGGREKVAGVYTSR